MNFGKALKILKKGGCVWRGGWYNKDMWLELQTPDTNSKMSAPYLYLTIPSPDEPYIKIPWVASQTDLLAEDWECST